MVTRLPRTPLVFAEKVRWRVPGQATYDGEEVIQGSWRNNYVSAVKYADEVELVLGDQADRGQVLVLDENVAVERYGPRLTVASLAAITKCVREDGSVELRIVHDGTHGVKLNTSMKVLDHVAHPSADDVQQAMRECLDAKIPFYGATADVNEAHRQVPVHPDDAPLQACQVRPGGPIFINLVGTFGVASAGYWWGRLGAALVRLLYAVLGDDLCVWLFLFADDFLLFSGGAHWVDGIILPLFLLRVMGVPISWRNVSAGFVVSWVGVEINLREWAL